jgi:hypothetical protein
LAVDLEQLVGLLLRKQGESAGEGSGSSSPAAGSPAAGFPAAGGPTSAQYDTVQVAPRGQKPAGTETRVDEITAKVENIDYAKRRVTLRGPRGNEQTIDVGDNVKNLDQVKKGDDIVIRHTEAVVVTK